MSQIQATQCDECGAITDDLHNKDWAHFEEQGDDYCHICKMKEAVTVNLKKEVGDEI